MRLVPQGFKGWIRILLTWGVLLLITGCGVVYMIRMPGKSYSGSFLPLNEEELEVRNYLKAHVKTLAGDIGERNFWHLEALGVAADYIEKVFRQIGYSVGIQEFSVKEKSMKNLEVEIAGVSHPDEIVLVGAHYDSVVGSPGANDNATGAAAVLEIARILSQQRFARTVRFVAFANEEPPFFLTKDMGSRFYARRSRERGENIVAMFSIETIGYYSEEAGSQHYPFPFSFFYPNTANFIGFVGNISSRNLVYQSIASFRQHTSFPSEGVAALGWMTGIGWSDQWSFWREGFPGIMITDTALFRYDPYHTQNDTPDKVDYDRMAPVVSGLARVVVDLAGLVTP